MPTPPPCLLDGTRFAELRPEERAAFLANKLPVVSGYKYASKSLRFTPKFKEVMRTFMHVLRINCVPLELWMYILDLCEDIRQEVICVEYRRVLKHYQLCAFSVYVTVGGDERALVKLRAAWGRLRIFLHTT